MEFCTIGDESEMPRKRQIDPDIWKSQQFVSLKSPWAKLMFIGMISNADDEGRMKASPFYLKTTIFPSSAYRLDRVLKWRNEIEQQKLIRLYNGLDGEEYLFLPTFKQHQYMTKRFPSKLPCPEVNNGLITDRQPMDNGLHGVGNGNGNGNGNLLTFEEIKNSTWYPSFKEDFPQFTDSDLAAALEWIEAHPKQRPKLIKRFLINWARKIPDRVPETPVERYETLEELEARERRQGAEREDR